MTKLVRPKPSPGPSGWSPDQICDCPVCNAGKHGSMASGNDSEAIPKPEVAEAMLNAVSGLGRYKGFHQQLPVNREFLETTFIAPVYMEPATVGQYSIEVEWKGEGELLNVVTFRMELMMGYRATKIKLPFNRRIHKLMRARKDGVKQLLMSDSPAEMFYHYPAVEAAHGRVLVGGLGLGMYANMISHKKEVKEVVVVEIDPDVIKLTGRYLRYKGKKVKVVKADLWEYLKAGRGGHFDFIYIDIYYTTSATEYLTTVVPMRKILKEKYKGVPAMFWAEEEMKSQINPEGRWEKEMLAKAGIKDLEEIE